MSERDFNQDKKKTFPFSNPFSKIGQQKEEKTLPEIENSEQNNNNNNHHHHNGFHPFLKISGFVSSKFNTGNESKLAHLTEGNEHEHEQHEKESFNPFLKIGSFFKEKEAKDKLPINFDTCTYEEVLYYAQEQDFTVEESYKFLYVGGYDILKRPVLVSNSNQLPKEVNFDRLLLYVVKLMDKIVEAEYALIYIRSDKNRPGFGWLRKAYKLLGRKYKKNLKALFIIHPTLWIKGIMRLFKPFISQKFWQKLYYIQEISELYKYVPRENIVSSLPQSIFQVEASKFKTAIFGANLVEVMGRNDHEDAEIPLIIEHCIQYLAKHNVHIVTGIFRLSGSAKTIGDLRKDFNTKRANEVKLDGILEVHVISGLLKQYLRELPDPIFPTELYSFWMTGITKTNREELTSFFKDFISKMPSLNQSIIRYLLALLYFISSNSEINQMTANNLAIVITPNIIKAPSSLPPEDIMKHGSVHTSLFSKMISYTPDFMEELSKDKPTVPLLTYFISSVEKMPTSDSLPYVHPNQNLSSLNNRASNSTNSAPLFDLDFDNSTNNTRIYTNPFEDDFDDLLSNAKTSSNHSSREIKNNTEGRNRTVALKQSGEINVNNNENDKSSNNNHFGKVICEYDFEASEPTELSFKIGDILFILSDLTVQEEEDWWEAKNPLTNENGSIPKNYVKKI